MSCRPESVTGYVDGVLGAEEGAHIAAHLETCASCRAQAEAERSLRARLRALQPLEPRPGFERDVRARLRQSRIRRLARVLLPLAAGLAALVLWLRGSPDAIARELAFDHVKCFRKEEPPAKVVGNDAALVSRWFERQGTPMPKLPTQAAGLQLQGARYCPLLDGTSVAHVYYRDGRRRLSLFVIPRGLRMEGPLSTTALGREVRLVGHGEQTLGVVGESAADVEALSAALLTRAASAAFPSRRP